MNSLHNYLETIILSKERSLITGGFNIYVDVPDDPDTFKLLDLREYFGLHQHITVPTHKFGHTLDLVITRQSEHTVNNSPW